MATPRRSVITPPDSPTPLKAEASIVDSLRVNLDLDTITAFPNIISNSEILSFQNEPDHPATTVLHAMKAIADNDTLYHHQVMKQPDHAKFREAMDKEIADQYGNGNFELIKRAEIPPNATALNAVWQMKHKRNLKTGAIIKYKARLNIDGSRMVQGRDYDLTYAPVATWNAIRLILIMVLLNKWHTVQLDYVLAFPQAPISHELFMQIPQGVTIPHHNPKDYVLKLKRNIYGQKQAARVWNQYLVSKLTSDAVGFTQSKYEECVFYKDDMIYVLYTDDSII